MTAIAAYILIHHDLNWSTSSSLSRSARGAAICMREARFACHPDPPSFCDLNEGLLNEFHELTMSGFAPQRDTNHGPNEHDTRFFESRAVRVGHSAFFRYACEASGCEELGLRTVSKDEPRAVWKFDGSWKQNPKSGVRNFCVTPSQRGFAADIHEPEACLACNYTQLSTGGQDA